jgi:hypothetical protein
MFSNKLGVEGEGPFTFEIYISTNIEKHKWVQLE